MGLWGMVMSCGMRSSASESAMLCKNTTQNLKHHQRGTSNIMKGYR